MRLKLIACEILHRELCAAVARSVNRVDIEFLPKGLHDAGQERKKIGLLPANPSRAGDRDMGFS